MQAEAPPAGWSRPRSGDCSARCSTSPWWNSDEIGTIGVGESTIPTARTFHHLLGIDEREFVRETQSSFKLGILFENWSEIGDRYIHSFGQIGRSTWMGDFHHLWLQAREEGFGGDLGDYCFELKAAEAGKFATSDKMSINYAYHLDAGRYARFLRGFAEAQGVRRIEGKISRVEQDGETGFISALALESGDAYRGRPVHRLHRLSRAADRADARSGL